MNYRAAARARRQVGRRHVHAAAFGAAALLSLALATLPRSGAVFSGTSNNAANSLTTDVLNPPTGVDATDGVTVSINWTATVDTYASGYRVLRSSSAGGPYTQIAQVTPRTNTSYVDSPAEGTWYYVVRTYFGPWESANSNESDARAWRAFNCPADANLRACIRFDVNVAGTYLDESGYSNTVVHTNTVEIPGISGNAISGGATQQYQMADSASLDLTTAMTVEGWLRFNSLPGSGRAGMIDNDGQYSVIYYAGTGLQCSNGLNALPRVAVPVGSWFHVACTWDGATLRLYLNGLPAGSMASTGTMATSNTNPVSLLDTSPVFDEPLNGALDNLRIWHAGRTQAQICADAGLPC